MRPRAKNGGFCKHHQPSHPLPSHFPSSPSPLKNRRRLRPKGEITEVFWHLGRLIYCLDQSQQQARPQRISRCGSSPWHSWVTAACKLLSLVCGTQGSDSQRLRSHLVSDFLSREWAVIPSLSLEPSTPSLSSTHHLNNFYYNHRTSFWNIFQT